jgi:nucleotide-binding universal stress UspA family protein
MFERLLVPLDGSEIGEGVLGQATQIAKGQRSQVTLLYVAPAEMHGLASAWRARIGDGDGRTAEEYLESVAGRLRPEGLAVETRVVGGYPSVEITRIAQEERFGLIAMATHGRSGVGRWVFGSTTDKVLHAVATPLLLRRPRAADPRAGADRLRTLVVPLDGSGLGESVLPRVKALAASMSLPVRLVQVVPTGTIAFAGMDPYAYDPKVFEIMTSAATEYLEGKTRELQQQGLQASYRVLQGYAPSRIIDLAEETEGSLIVISTHGRSGVGRWVLGSVADRVLRASFRPVLIIRPQTVQEQ